jgi:hypothetical protein
MLQYLMFVGNSSPCQQKRCLPVRTALLWKGPESAGDAVSPKQAEGRLFRKAEMVA